MKLLIVIPALNEEQSIESIILRTHAAREYICANSKVTSVEIVVVSDGSTDDTVKIASQHSDKAKLIVFEHNRGYGAAIKEGWHSSANADLLAFLDADGTCDPNFFVTLCNSITEEGADIAIGSRLSKESKMPLVRRIGNTLFSILLSFVSSERIKDTASGMRVIRKSVLNAIMPLPDGLNFTPAMSARAILSRNVKVIEKDMTYSEREGESKLKIWKDGKRFLFVILENVFLYVPYKIFSLVASLCILFALVIMATPITFYVQKHFLEDWMIYRFLVADVAGLIALLLLAISSITSNVVHFSLQSKQTRKKNILYYLFEHNIAIFISVLCYIIGSLLIVNSIWHRLTTGLTNEHWSRYITMIFFYVAGAIVFLTYLVNKILGLVKERLAYFESLQK
jgi:glycosyltransferase involved in cell wall biosynthesis